MLFVTECLWWWNPLFWLVRRQVRQNAELACDAWVVSTLPDDRRAYAEALIEVSQLVSTGAAPVPALGMSRGPRQAFAERLTMIMRNEGPCKLTLRGFVVVGLLALLVLPGWSLAQKADDKKKEVAPAGDVIYERIDDEPAKGELIINKIQKPGSAIQEDGTPVTVTLDDEQIKQRGGVSYFRTAQGDRDKKLMELEQRLEGLLKEIKALRGAKPGEEKPKEVLSERKDSAGERNRTYYEVLSNRTTAKPGVASEELAAAVKALEGALAKQPDNADLKKALAVLKDTLKAGSTGAVRVPVTVRVPTTQVHSVRIEGTTYKTITLSRATYKLDKAKAEALAAFLRDHVKAQVMEAKAVGDGLEVTTTPEAQKAIGQLIGLLGGETKAKSSDTRPSLQFKLQELKDGKLLYHYVPQEGELKLDNTHLEPLKVELKSELKLDKIHVEPLKLKEKPAVKPDEGTSLDGAIRLRFRDVEDKEIKKDPSFPKK